MGTLLPLRMLWRVLRDRMGLSRLPSTDDRRPTTDDRRPTTDDRRPTTDDRRPTSGIQMQLSIAARLQEAVQHHANLDYAIEEDLEVRLRHHLQIACELSMTFDLGCRSEGVS